MYIITVYKIIECVVNDGYAQLPCLIAGEPVPSWLHVESAKKTADRLT